MVFVSSTVIEFSPESIPRPLSLDVFIRLKTNSMPYDGNFLSIVVLTAYYHSNFRSYSSTDYLKIPQN